MTTLCCIVYLEEVGDMSNRITNADVDYVFERLVNQARNRNVNTEGWSFGRPFGQMYYITNKRNDIIAGGWATKREAWEGIMGMSAGLCLVPFTE